MLPSKTQRLTREQIAAAVGNNPRAIKLFESLLGDVSDTLPADIQSALAAAVAADASAAAAQASADAAAVAAAAAQQSADLAQSLVMTTRDYAATVDKLRRDLEGLQSLALQLAT